MFSELVQGYWRMSDWAMNAQEHLSFIKQHLELGITTVDHAHVYGGTPSCEELFGRALQLDPSIRQQIEVVSKCGIELIDSTDSQVNHYDSTASTIKRSVETSLQRLGIETLDVLLIHRPDWLMDVDAVAETFSDLNDSGKVRNFGVSNFTASQFALLQSRVKDTLMTNQVEINPLNIELIEDGTLDQLYQAKVKPMAWSCLAGGRIFSESTEQVSRLKDTLQDITREVGADSIDQILYAWVKTLPCQPVAIIGSGNIERVKAAVNSLGIELTQEQWYRVWVAAKGHGVP